MPKFVRILLILFPLVIACGALAQEMQYNFRQISMDRGLPGQNVRLVYQDNNGVIWISVEGIGLSRYDGRNFELFAYNPEDTSSLSNNYVNSIIEDPDSNLWIATEKGLNKYIRNKNKFRRYTSNSKKQSGLTSNLIQSLFIDSKNVLWVGSGRGLHKYNRKSDTFEYVKLINDNEQHWIFSIFEHSSGDFFIGTNKGLIKYSPKTKETQQWNPEIASDSSLSHRIVRSIIEDFQGNLWIATHRGLDKLNYATQKVERWKFLPKHKSLFENEGFNHLYTKNLRQLWVASYTTGILVINTETKNYQLIRKEENTEGSLKSNHVRHIFQDKSGLLWISTKFEGLFCYDKRKDMFNKLPKKYDFFKQVKNMHILSLYKDSKKKLFWVGTKYNGLFRIDLENKKVENYTHDIKNKTSIGSNRIHEVYRDSEGHLWVGLGSGLDYFDEKANQFKHYSQIMTDCIIEDIEHKIWAGTNEGLFVVNKTKEKLERFVQKDQPLFSNDVINVLASRTDKKGQIWFSTRHSGLLRYNPFTHDLKLFTSKNTKKGLRSDAIRAISEDQLGNIWLGTKGEGLCIYDPKENGYSYLTSAQGLVSDFILCLQQDFNGDFWAATNNGLSKYNTRTKEFTNYSTVHGLQGNIFELDANEILDDGYMVFGGYNGLNIFHPDKIDYSNLNFKDSVLITSVKVQNEEILRDVYKNTSLKLSHKQNYITIEFVLSDFVDPLNHNYSYRVKEISDKWFDIGNKNYVAFSNLPPGSYHFEVRGTNEFGVTSEKPLTMFFKINPPFYQTWWFRFVIIATLLLLSFSIIRIKITANKRARKNLENEILKRTEELREANSELIAQNQLIESQKEEIEKNKIMLEEKVLERTKDLEKAKQKAEESDRLKSSFLANMSHEIRTPLNAILGFSSLIVDTVEDDMNLTNYSEHINNSSQMLLKIINDILDLSKIEAGQLKVVKTEGNIKHTINAVYNTFYQQIQEKHKGAVDFIIKTPLKEEFELIVYTDFVRLKQIIFNLMSNAIKFTKKGFIEFGFSQEEGFVKFYVKDTGVGIKKEYLSTIFNHFFKVEGKGALYRGNGLGLSLCKSLSELLGGSIWVESLENHGSTFYFTIPDEKSYVIEVQKQ